MNIEDVITLEDNQEYLILDIAELNGIKYLYTVLVDKEDMPTTDYQYFELSEDEDGTSVEEIEDEETLKAIINLFTIRYLGDSINTNEEQEV